ncbi:MAG TPA: flagellar hook-associated protein FlgL [Polyangiaceae bacterium]
MRVTETLRFDLVSRRLSTLRSKYQQTALESTTGQRVNAPSDDPVAAAEAARVRAGLAQSQANTRSIDLVKGDVEMAEAALDQAGNVFQRAREIAMAGANGANGSDQRQALAIEANQLVSQVIEIANAKGSQGYLFAGTRWDAPAFDSTGAFVGNDQQHLVQTGAGEPIAVNVSGSQAFTSAGGIDVIQELRNLAEGLKSEDMDAIRSTLDGLQTAHEQVQRERSHAGLILNRIQLSETILNQTDLDLSRRETDVVTADPTETFSRLSQLEGAINNSVTVGKRLLDIGNIQRF